MTTLNKIHQKKVLPLYSKVRKILSYDKLVLNVLFVILWHQQHFVHNLELFDTFMQKIDDNCYSKTC